MISLCRAMTELFTSRVTTKLPISIAPTALMTARRENKKTFERMSRVNRPSASLRRPIKHFTAYDPIAKWTIGRVSGQASASSAKSLFDKLLDEAPFAVRGIQVDGGAEFKSVFEAECQARGLELFVLPPKRPDLNGCVERAQSTWRYESK